MIFMSIIEALYFIIRMKYIETGFDVDKTSRFLINNFGYKTLILLNTFIVFLRDFELKKEIGECINSAIINYHYVENIKGIEKTN